MRIELQDVSKRFGSHYALKDVSLLLQEGKVHALVGENGAGKSTCLGIAGGRLQPSSGRVRLNGTLTSFRTPRDASKQGIVSVYQELSIIPHLTAVQNVFLGQERRRWRWGEDRESMRHAFNRACEELDLRFDPDGPAGRLSVGDQQMLEIMKAVVSEAQAVFLDEPTAALGPRERRKLFDVIARLIERKVIVAFVSHNLDEVLEISDEITVFRDGEIVESRPKAEWDRASLTTSMIGGGLRTRSRARTNALTGSRTPIRATNVSVDKVSSVSIEVSPGETVGIAGLVGSGRSTLLRALAGDQPASEGTLSFPGSNKQSLPNSVREARSRGIFLLHEDRKGAGLLPEASAGENIELGNHHGHASAGFLKSLAIRKQATTAARNVKFDLKRMSTPVEKLSGGNQQKSLLARALLFKPRLLLADEPTRGVDVGAKAEIFASIEQLADEGTAILMVSSEFEELAENCSRVYVLWKGMLIEHLQGEDVTVENMVRSSFGFEERAA